jgi:VWFA-related protein
VVSRIRFCKRNQILFLAVFCVTVTSASAPQEIDSDEVHTHSGPYLPNGAFGFRIDTKLVEIPVVVRDNRGRPVEGLRREDFEVFDVGRKQKITSFVVREYSRPGPLVMNAPVADAPGNAGKVESKGSPRNVALVFDDESVGFDNLTPDGLSRAVEAGTRFLHEGFSDGDRAAVFSLSQGPVSPLTTDTSKLIEAMKSLRIHRRLQPPSLATGCLTPYGAYVAATRNGGGSAPGQISGRVGPGGKRPPGAGPASQRQATARALWTEVRMNSQRLLEMLRDIVDYMGKLAGERIVLVASPGFQTGTLEAETADVIDHAVRAGVVINSMDMTGLWAGPTGADCSPGWAIGPEMQQAADQVLSNLASGTGGRFFHNNNDLLQGFRDSADLPEVSYLVGFAPDDDGKGGYHKVQVHVSPANHYAVQSRPGYFAADADKPRQERPIDRAVMDHDTRDDIPVRVSMMTDQVNGVPAVWAVAHVDVGKVEFRRVDDRRVQNLTMVAALFDAQGNFVVGKEGGIEFSLKDGSFTMLSKEGVNCTLTLLAPPGVYRLRMVVMDAVSGRLVAPNETAELR